MADRRRRLAEEAMATLARERGKALTSYAYLLTGNMRDADDLVQDAMVKTFARARGLEATDPEGYVRRAILTTFVDGYRRRRRWDAMVHVLARAESSPGPDDAVSTRVDVERALRLLPPRQRACLVLRYYDDLTVPEIADRLGLADGTVKGYLHSAVQRMEDLLGPTAPPTATEAVDVRVTRTHQERTGP
jgi:RNA polymerase sigma-70 factor (sigma-E family)